MGTTDTPDTPAETTRTTASDKFLIMSSATGRGATKTGNIITPVTGKGRYCCLEGNLGTLASLGTSAAATANATYVSPVFIRHPMLITGIGILERLPRQPPICWCTAFTMRRAVRRLLPPHCPG
jgi:hypothetical protein